MSTGVVVDDEVLRTFEELKLTRNRRYFICHIVDRQTIKIEKTGELSKTYSDFCADLPDDSCRYGVIDLDFTTTDGRPTSKLVLFNWNPDSASIKEKMFYSASKEAIKSRLIGVGIHIQPTNRSELDFETEVLPVCQKFS